MNARHAAESAALKAHIDDMAELLKATQGKGNAQVLNTLLRRALGAASQT